MDHVQKDLEDTVPLPPNHIEQLLSEGQSTRPERRRHRRYAYPLMQWLAPYDGATLPDLMDLDPVECVNISEGGIAFRWPTRPSFDRAVLCVANSSTLAFLTLEVVHCTPNDKTFIVGCRFNERLTGELRRIEANS